MKGWLTVGEGCDVIEQISHFHGHWSDLGPITIILLLDLCNIQSIPLDDVAVPLAGGDGGLTLRAHLWNGRRRALQNRHKILFVSLFYANMNRVSI